MKVTVNVTQEDIEANSYDRTTLRSRSCPVAKALSRAIGEPCVTGGIYWSREGEKDTHHFLLPEQAAYFIRKADNAFDSCVLEENPFSFEIEIPDLA
jgi:hypothetical protein